jgi:periplasmic divalent cation tolerance protein
MNTGDYIVIMSTVSGEAEGQRIADGLVSRGLAACVNVLPGVTSYYKWQGKSEVGQELLMLIKTRASNYGKIRDVIKELHSYEVPEIVALPIVSGDESYLKWIDECLGVVD